MLSYTFTENAPGVHDKKRAAGYYHPVGKTTLLIPAMYNISLNTFLKDDLQYRRH